MKKLSPKETEQYIVENYIGYNMIRDMENRDNLVRWIRSAQDRWLYVFEDIFYIFHIMGYEVFFKEDKWIVGDTAIMNGELKKGDIIERVNGLALEKISTPFKGEGGILVEIIRDGKKKQITLKVPECTYSNSKSHLTSALGTMPSIDMCSFGNVDKHELEEIVKENTHIRIDLRKNMGGSINEMIEILGIVSPHNVEIVVADSKGEHHKKLVKCSGISKIRKIELMVSNMTASSAEIFVGYLSRICKVIIIGEETAGKFVIHRYIDTEIGTVAVPVYKVLFPRKIENGISIEPYFREKGFSPKDSYMEGEIDEFIIK